MKALVNTRLVWAAVSRNPTATSRQLAEATGLGHSTVRDRLKYLEHCGYIQKEPGKGGTRRVRVPLLELERRVLEEIGEGR